MAEQLYGTLQRLLPQRADAVALAPLDIKESAQEIYSNSLPALLEASDGSKRELRERLWELREEFRHIEYHTREGELTGLYRCGSEK